MFWTQPRACSPELMTAKHRNTVAGARTQAKLYACHILSDLSCPIRKCQAGGERDGSVIKSLYCSCTEPEFGSQNLHWVSYNHLL